MVLLIHIIIASAGIVAATYLLIAPSQLKFKLSYSLTAFTLISGTYLTISQPAHLLQACVSGLAYISFVLLALIAARAKFAKENL